MSRRDAIPPFSRPDRTIATGSRYKASFLAELSVNIIKVDDLGLTSPQLTQKTHCTVTIVSLTTEQVDRVLSAVDVAKATGTDDVILRFLKQCTKELSVPLSTVFTSRLGENKWPT